MFVLGKKGEVPGEELLEKVALGELKSFPSLKDGFSLVCEFDNYLKTELIACRDFADVAQLNASYASGCAKSLKWYQGPDVGTVKLIVPGQDPA